MKRKSSVVACTVGITCGLAICLIIDFTTGFTFDKGGGPDKPLVPALSQTDFSLDLHELATTENLVELVAEERPFVRHIQLRVYLEGQDQLQLEHLLDQITNSEAPQPVTDLQELLVEFIARFDPEMALSKVWGFTFDDWPKLVESVFKEWATVDLLQAVQASSTLRGTPRRTALKTIIESVPDSTTLLEVAKFIGIDHEVEILRAELTVAPFLSQPATVFELVFADSIDDSEQEDLLSFTAESWISKEGAEIFPQLLSIIKQRFENSTLGNNDSTRLLNALVETIAASNPQYMWSLAIKESGELQSFLTRATLKAWSKVDIQQALIAVEEFEPAESLRTLYSFLISTWTSQDPKTVLNSLHTIRPEHRRRTLSWGIRYLYQIKGAEESIEVLKQLEEQGENVALATEFLCTDWAKQDANAALDWVLSTQSEHENIQSVLLRAVLPEVAALDASRALSVAQQNPSTKGIPPHLTLEVQLVESVAARGQLQVAKNLLESVSQPNLGAAYLSIGKVLLSWNSIDEALSLGRNLPKELQYDYFEWLTLDWLYTSPETLTKQLAKLPRDNATVVARTVLNSHGEHFLTAEEISTIESFTYSE